MSVPVSKSLRTILQLEAELSRDRQDILRGLCLIVLAISISMLHADQHYDIVNETVVIGGILILAALYIELVMLRLFSNSAYFSGLQSATGSGNYRQFGLTYDAATLVVAGEKDLTRAFLESDFGQAIYSRSELTTEVVTTWLSSARQQIPASVVSLPQGRATSFIDIVQSILSHDSDFITFLSSYGVTKETILGATHLVLGHYYHGKRQERWWSRDVLSRRGSVGRELTLGAWRDYVPYTTAIKSNPEEQSEFEQHYLNFIHTALQSRRDSNLLLIAPDNDINDVLLQKLQHSFVAGTALGAINAMSILSINHDELLLSHATTISVESALRTILYEASRAGNMIIVVNDLVATSARYAARGVLFTHIIEEFLTTDHLHIIVCASTKEYPELKRTELSLLKRCTEVVVEPLTEETLLRYLTHEIFKIERIAKTRFSYHALTAIAKVVYAYDIPSGARVTEIATRIAADHHGQSIITHTMAERSLGTILDLPVGPLTSEERDVLISIERIMQQHVVGQERAIEAIGIALRRMRAALTDSRRPFASFLFLGPSGVGKTETAKTLALVYFKNEEAMTRFDMSEFSDESSITRLLGSATESSILEDAILKMPRGLLLLDEFEKAHPSVQELFLQILDEGHITTHTGNEVRFQQHIIIATSNAGSDLIARTKDKRASSPILDSDIIAHIIQTRALAPELIGRFGDVILFDALSQSAEVTIAHQLITKLEQKIRERGYTLTVAPEVAMTIVGRYHQSEFGARPIRHAIEHILEDIIAKRIIAGDLRTGDTITITVHDLPAQTRIE